MGAECLYTASSATELKSLQIDLNFLSIFAFLCHFFPYYSSPPCYVSRHHRGKKKEDSVYNLGVTPLKGNIISSGGMCGKDEQMQEFKWRLIA